MYNTESWESAILLTALGLPKARGEKNQILSFWIIDTNNLFMEINEYFELLISNFGYQ